MPEFMLWGTALIAFVLMVVALSATWVRLSRYQTKTNRGASSKEYVVIQSLAAELGAHSTSPPHNHAQRKNKPKVGKRPQASVVVSLPLADTADPSLHQIVIPANKRNLRIAA